MDLENIQDWIIPFLTTIGLITATILYSFSKFREIKDNASQELIKTLKETADAEKEKAGRLQKENQIQREDFQRQITELKEGHQKQINEIKIEMEKLKTLYESSERSKQEYLLILQGKNPEQQKFMQFLTEAATTSNKTQEDARAYMEHTSKVLQEILISMKDLHDRNKIVDIQQNKTLEVTRKLVK